MATDTDHKMGLCEECEQLNLYSSLLCQHCKARLPWADALEAAMLEAVSQQVQAASGASTNHSAAASTTTGATQFSKPVVSIPKPAPPPLNSGAAHPPTTVPQGFVQAAHPSPLDPARVRVSARILDWPYTCACCGQSLEGPGAVGHKVISVSTQSAMIPYCTTCSNHVHLAVSGDNAFGSCILLAILGFLPLAALFHAISDSTAFSLLSAFITGAALVIVGYQDRQSKLAAARALLNSGCCDVRHAVIPGFGLGTTHSFLFKRREYAEAFIQANRQKVIG